MKKLFNLILISFLFNVAFCNEISTEDNLPPVELVNIQIAEVPLVKIDTPNITIPSIKMIEVKIPDDMIADIGIHTPESFKSSFKYISDIGISTPKNFDNKTFIISGIEIADVGIHTSKSECFSTNYIPDIGIKTPFSDPYKFSAQTNGNPAQVFVPHISSISKNLNDASEFFEMIKIFRDQRNILNDPEAFPGSILYKLWYDVYQKNQNYTMSYIPLPQNLRMIAEIRFPINYNVLEDNLAFYANQGYNAVLISFDGSEKFSELVSIARKCKSMGISPWFAYGGRDTLKTRVFITPADLKRTIGELAPLCDGMLLGWRRTSQHLFIPDDQFINYIVKSARDANPNICIVGEGYIGYTAKHQNNSYVVTANVPVNSSGCLIINIGYMRVNTNVLNTVFGKIAVPKIVLVSGEQPYYKNRNNFGFNKNFEIKKKIEARFRASGAVGTITLHGDGSSQNDNDNIAHSGRN